jgi:signal transduction histidine kinase
LEIIDREVERCTAIVDRLLDFSRPKRVVRSAVALDAMVEETLFLLKHHQRFKGFAVDRELAAGLPSALGSREQLIQVLMALVLNAADAMEQGGTLTIRTGRVPGRAGEVFLEVADTGPGIPREDQDRIFEPFFTTKPPGRGTGLGLSICYAIVAAHQGRIEVDSAPGRGARFRIHLPVAAAA